MTRFALLLSLLFALVATGCTVRSGGRGGGGGGDDDDSAVTDDDDVADDDDVGDDDDDGAVDYETGTWVMTMGQVLVDTCFDSEGQTGGSLGTTQVASIGSGGVDFTMRDSDDQFFECGFSDGTSFECIADPVDIPVEGWQVEIARTGFRSGVFASASQLSFVQDNVDTCTGPDCSALEEAGGFQFPCTVTFSATAEF